MGFASFLSFLKKWTFELQFLLAAVAGAFLPIQASMNAGMIEPLHSTIVPALVSYIVGLFSLLLVFPLDTRKRTEKVHVSADGLESKKAKSVFGNFRERVKETPKWLFCVPYWIGLYYILLSIIVGKRLGFGLFFICIVTGQLLSAAIVDHLGLFNIPQKKISVYRLATISIVLFGAILSVSQRINVTLPTGELIGFMLVSLSSGFLLSMQAPMNAKLTRSLQTLPHRTVSMNITMGTITLLIFFPISLHWQGPFNFERFRDITWWKFLGGALGAFYANFSIILAPRIGVSFFFIAVIAGQLLSSMLIDTLGWLDSTKISLTTARLIGVIVVFLATVMFRLEHKLRSAFGCIKTPEISVPDHDKKIDQIEQEKPVCENISDQTEIQRV